MKQHPGGYLDNPEARLFADQLLEEMLAAERQLDIIDEPDNDTCNDVRSEYKDAFPEYVVVRAKTLRHFLTRSALAGAGYINAEQVPDDLREQVDLNMDVFKADINHLFDREPDTSVLTGFTYNFYALEPQAVTEILAHHFLVVGRISRLEVDE